MPSCGDRRPGRSTGSSGVCRRARCAPTPMLTRPLEIVHDAGSAAPTRKPRPNTWRTSRISCRSSPMKLERTAKSYDGEGRREAAPSRRSRDRREGGFGRQAPRLDGVVHALQRSGCSPSRHRRRTAADRERGGRRGRAWNPPPGMVFAPHSIRSPPSRIGRMRRVRLRTLEQVVQDRSTIAVVEPDHHADRHHVVAHRVDEGAAELAVLRLWPQRPPHRGDDAVEGLRRPSTPPSPRAPTPGGRRPWRPKWSRATPVRWPWVPSASTVTRATMSLPGS